MRKIAFCMISIFISASLSCSKFLDIVPDNVPDLEMAFNLRNTAERFLATCYSYLPSTDGAPIDQGSWANNVDPTFYNSLEATHSNFEASFNVTQIALGNQRTASPFGSKWTAKNVWEGIRHCNIFIDNIMAVPDMKEAEKNSWKAEVIVLRAYYHYVLFLQVGPIPIIDKNLALGEKSELLKVKRMKVDDCISFMVNSVDEAATYLNDVNTDLSTFGRITKLAALAFKAKLLVYAASPFYNGNTDYVHFKNEYAENFFNQQYDPNKWKLAVDACKEAIELANTHDVKLFKYQLNDLPPLAQLVSKETKIHLNIRGALTERFNPEILWANIQSVNHGMQFSNYVPRFYPNAFSYGNFSVSINTAEEFYTNNGVPIEEDLHWDFSNRFAVTTTSTNPTVFLIPNYKTSKLNIDREIRFYANLGFDGGTWYGQGVYDEKAPFLVMAKKGQAMFSNNPYYFNLTGYYAKKLVPFKYEIRFNGTTTPVEFPFPIIRLTDLYLLYAEALNELSGPSPEVFKYLDPIRERAGLKSVVESWAQFSIFPTKPSTQQGLREIIRKERRIELNLEGQKFWDFIRWKIADVELSKPLLHWDTSQENADYYYRVKSSYIRQFTLRDYLWPIDDDAMFTNKNLIQNPGW